MLALQSRLMETFSPLEVLRLLWQLAQRAEVRKSSAGFSICGGGLRARGQGRDWADGNRATHREAWFMINAAQDRFYARRVSWRSVRAA